MIHSVIVEDDPMVAKINKQYLECLGDYTVDRICTNSAEALEYLRSHAADLIIMDVFMPGIDGIELLRTLRGEKHPASVIMVTAANDAGTVNAALQLGVVDYLIKPYSFERFTAAVQKYASKVKLLGTGGTVDQDTVNRLLSNHWTGSYEQQELRKGLSAQTLEAIIACMMQNPGKHYSCESLSAAYGLSKVTVRHYVNYLIETGRVLSSVDYETGGRPGVRYQIICE